MPTTGFDQQMLLVRCCGSQRTAQQQPPGRDYLNVLQAACAQVCSWGLRLAANLSTLPLIIVGALQQGAALNLAGGATTTGQYIRQGPDGRGGRATHVAPSKKRVSVQHGVS